MAYGLEIRDASSNVIFDSRVATGGVVYGTYDIPSGSGSSVVVTLSSYPGRTVRTLGSYYKAVTSYSSGYPVVTLTPYPTTRAGYATIFVY